MNNEIFYAKSASDFNLSVEKVRRIYEHITDEISKDIFIKRLMISFTEDFCYLSQLCKINTQGKKMETTLSKYEKVYIYGAGIRGKKVKDLYPLIKFAGYIDKNKTGVFEGLKIYKLDEVEVDDNSAILISVKSGYEELIEYIKRKKKTQHIYAISAYEDELYKEQYFEERCITNFIAREGAFIDGGAYDGYDSKKFVDTRLYSGNDIYIYEPDSDNLKKCQTVMSSIKNVIYHEACLGKKEGYVAFVTGNGQLGQISENGNSYVKVEMLDKIFENKEVSYIKLDVEGSELDALQGAERIIREQHPYLMVSVYHKAEDIITIPELLLSYNNKYKFKLGHYGISGAYDTVLYVYE